MGFRDARREAGLTVLEVSRKLLVSPAAIYHWEDGMHLPSSKRLPDIARLYDCSIGELLHGNTPDRTRDTGCENGSQAT